MSLPRYKIGDCTRCPAKDTECKKRGKGLACLQCCKIEDVAKQTAKANLKQRVRSIGNKQIQEGNYEDASRQGLIRDMDWVFSRIVRQREADKYDNIENTKVR